MVLVIDWLLLYHYSILMHPQAAWNFHAKLGGDVDFYEQYTILIGVSVPMFLNAQSPPVRRHLSVWGPAPAPAPRGGDLRTKPAVPIPGSHVSDV